MGCLQLLNGLTSLRQGEYNMRNRSVSQAHGPRQGRILATLRRTASKLFVFQGGLSFHFT